MISEPDRSKAIELIDEAHASGARLSKACEELGIDERTYYRWVKLQKEHGSCEDRRPLAEHPEPANKLSAEERQQVLDTVNDPKYASMPPCEIVPALADEGIYIASESTFYRVLRDEKMQNHRGRAEEPQHRPISSHEATAPNQVWMWDITYLRGPIKGLFYYLYMIIDLFSRDIVGWEVWDTEDSEHASELIRRACLKQQRLTTSPLVLHSDNGTPMKGATMLETLYKLGITPSNSRPSVSNDNAYSESIFKTLKYRPNYQPKGFASIEEARAWCADFVQWYRYEHHHSGIKFLCPADLHEGHGQEKLEKRHDLYELAKERHPERWNGRATRNWTLPDVVYLNPVNESEKVRPKTDQEEQAANAA